MKSYLNITLSALILISPVLSVACKDKKEHPMMDIESIKYDGSRDEKHIFREELKKEQEKKERMKKYGDKESE